MSLKKVLSAFFFVVVAFSYCCFLNNRQYVYFLMLITVIGVLIYNRKRFSPHTLMVILMTLLLSYNFFSNALNKKNETFYGFQADSEELVTAIVDARKDGIKDTGNYGLGWYNKETESVSSYTSSYGLQGRVFKFFYFIPGKHIICIFLTALVLSMIVFAIARKYDLLFAFCFFITFLLSPWIVNFARNLYWVEFTWWIPMLLGIIISLNYENKRIIISCFAGIFISVLVKSLCGYEYLSVILLAMIAVPSIDLFNTFFKRNYKKSFSIFKIIFIMGLLSIFGFLLALLIHGNLRGEGDIRVGLQSIYEQDVLRRTLGGNSENFPEIFKESLEASIATVVLLYHFFPTEVVAGIDGALFRIIVLIPIMIFAFRALFRKLILKDVIMYFIFYITCISWFILGKSHSYLHRHMNYVLWYFGFIQICFYIILRQVIDLGKSITKYLSDKNFNIKEKIMENLYE